MAITGDQDCIQGGQSFQVLWPRKSFPEFNVPRTLTWAAPHHHVPNEVFAAADDVALAVSQAVGVIGQGCNRGADSWDVEAGFAALVLDIASVFFGKT